MGEPAGKGKNTAALLVVLFGAAFVAAFNENIINVALVDIMAAYAIDSVTAQWLVTGYMIVASIVIAIMSWLSRRVRLRPLFFGAVAVFVIGSVGCYLASNFAVLMVFRLIQAVGTGVFIPTMMGTVMSVAPREKLGFYLSIGSCCITLGPAFGPVVSGVMVTAFGWHAVFIPATVAILVLAAVGAKTLYNVHPADVAELDALSVALLAVGLTLVVFGLTQLTTALALALACVVVGCAIITLFGRRQLRLEQPVMNVRPLISPWFSFSCVLSVVAMMTSFSMSVMLPLYFQGSLMYSALISGLLILLPIAINAVAALVAGRIMDAKGEWPLLPAGFAFILVGQAAICLLAPSMSIVPVMVAACVVYGGVGLVMSPSQTAGLKTLKPHEHPHGVSIVNTFMMVAGSLGPSLFVGILSSGSAAAQAAGQAEAAAQAIGFSQAILVAAGIALVGFVISFVYARKAAIRG